MKGREPLLAPLQQTDPRTAMVRNLPPRRKAIMLDTDQGSANSRKSSPGVELSIPLRDAFEPLPPVDRPSVQLNQPAPTLPTAYSPGPIRRDSAMRGVAPWLRETGPQFRRH